MKSKKKKDVYFVKKEKHQGLIHYVIYERTLLGLINVPYDFYLDEDLALLVASDLNTKKK